MSDSKILFSQDSVRTKRPHDRTTFATPTLKLINGRIAYYRKILKQELNTNNAKQVRQHKKLQMKYDRDMKIRYLLNRAISHRYK